MMGIMLDGERKTRDGWLEKDMEGDDRVDGGRAGGIAQRLRRLDRCDARRTRRCRGHLCNRGSAPLLRSLTCEFCDRYGGDSPAWGGSKQFVVVGAEVSIRLSLCMLSLDRRSNDALTSILSLPGIDACDQCSARHAGRQDCG
eukprot:290690-Rhodomonas_salina.4